MKSIYPLFSLLLLLLPPPISLVRAEFNFNNYPLCAQSVLYTFAPLSCDFGSNGPAEADETDACLCVNTGYLSDAATNIFKSCGCQDLTASAQVNSNNCARFQTDSAYSVQDFINAGSSTCSGSGGLSAGDIIGIVFGVVMFPGLIVAILQLFVALGWIRPSVAPWPKIKRFLRPFCRCC